LRTRCAIRSQLKSIYTLIEVLTPDFLKFGHVLIDLDRGYIYRARISSNGRRNAESPVFFFATTTTLKRWSDYRHCASRVRNMISLSEVLAQVKQMDGTIALKSGHCSTEPKW
jgi:hypothetical protein